MAERDRNEYILVVDDTTTLPTLPAGSHLIRISYAALDFLAPRKQRFRVRLGDERDPWQDMRGETTVNFLELPPGRHTIAFEFQPEASGAPRRIRCTITPSTTSPPVNPFGAVSQTKSTPSSYAPSWPARSNGATTPASTRPPSISGRKPQRKASGVIGLPDQRGRDQ